MNKKSNYLTTVLQLSIALYILYKILYRTSVDGIINNTSS